MRLHTDNGETKLEVSPREQLVTALIILGLAAASCGGVIFDNFTAKECVKWEFSEVHGKECVHSLLGPPGEPVACKDVVTYNPKCVEWGP